MWNLVCSTTVCWSPGLCMDYWVAEQIVHTPNGGATNQQWLKTKCLFNHKKKWTVDLRSMTLKFGIWWWMWVGDVSCDYEIPVVTWADVQFQWSEADNKKRLYLISSSRILHFPQLNLFVLNFSGLVCLSGFCKSPFSFPACAKKPIYFFLLGLLKVKTHSLWVVMTEPGLTAIMKEHKLQSPVSIRH